MPAPTAYSSSQPSHLNPLYPALYLYPLNDSFVPKHITLHNSQRVKIGRQTNAKTVPAERNGYFDSKVLSRQHAEVWEEGGKIYIKDVKSSNGTFINGERLSGEGLESEPYELKSDDIVEFGIDIVAEDNKTIIHHKVAARVVCVFSEQDAQIAARAEAHHHHQQQVSSSLSQATLSPTGPSNIPPVFGFGGRRPPIQPQLGGMGGGMRPPGSSKSGLTFDHILNRLQGELQKSKDTSAELSNLTGTINEIGDVLGGNAPQNHVPYSQSLPPVRPLAVQPLNDPPLSEPLAVSSVPDATSAASLEALTALQNQLQNTQTSLASHQDKIRTLENVVEDHETMKREVALLKDIVESLRTDGDVDRIGVSREDEEEQDSEADAKSVSTIIPRPHELESVQEEDEETLADDLSATFITPFATEEKEVEEDESEEERRRRRDELDRPGTPEPSSLGLDFRLSPTRSKMPFPHSRLSPTASSTVDELAQRLGTLSVQLESALELSSTLQAQYATAQGTIKALEEKVERLEELVRTVSVSTSQTPLPQTTASEIEQARISDRETFSRLLAAFQASVESQWSTVRLEWGEEREWLNRTRQDVEAKMKVLENGIETVNSYHSLNKVSSQCLVGNGDSRNGLVTPPSPRSLSSDSNQPRRRRRGRSRSRSCSRGRSASRATSSTLASDSEDNAASPASMENTDQEHNGGVFPITPESSVRLGSDMKDSTKSTRTNSDVTSGDVSVHINKHRFMDANMSTAIGVLVLGVAAATVLWRVKPE